MRARRSRLGKKMSLVRRNPPLLRRCNVSVWFAVVKKPSLCPPHRWVPREQTDQASAPRTVASRGLASDHGEGTSRPGRATTPATRHPEAEDGPLGEPHAETSPPTVGTHCTCLHWVSLRRVVTHGSVVHSWSHCFALQRSSV